MNSREGTLSRWFSRSIANRLAVATATGIACVVLLLAALAYGQGRTLLLHHAHDELRGDAALLAQRLSLLLEASETEVAGLAANSLVGNALLDSSGRSAYLGPFLRDLRSRSKFAATLTLTDHLGKALVSNATAAAPDFRRAPWLESLMSSGKPVVRLSGTEQPVLLLAYAVVVPNSTLPDGTLVLEVPLAPMFAEAMMPLRSNASARLFGSEGGTELASLRHDEIAPGSGLTVSRDVGVAESMAPLGLRLELTVARAEALRGLGTMTLTIGAVGILTLLLGAWIAHAGMRRSLRPLRTLGQLSERIRIEQRFDVAVPDCGRDEIGELARSFDHLMASVREAQHDLETKVDLRTAALEHIRARLDAVQRQMNDALLVIAANGCIDSFSGAAERLFGCTSAEAVGRGVGRLLPTWVSLVARSAVAVGADFRFRGTVTARRGSDEFLADVSVSLTVFDRNPYWVVLVRDVTTQRRNEQHLQEANRLLEDSVQRLRQHDDDMAQIHAMSELLASCQSSDEAHDVIERALTRLFEGHDGALAVHRGGGAMQTVARWGAGTVCREEIVVDDCWGLRLGRPHQGGGLLVPPCGHAEGHAEGLSCLPLSVQGETMALLMLRAVAPDVRHRLPSLLPTVGEAIKIGLSNLRLREALRAAALRDALTGLYNRRHFDDSAPRELQRAGRTGRPIALALLDLDHFKRFNDGYGHEAGDAVLREAARVLVDGLRGSDLVYRLGGEELAVLLPDSTADDAAKRLDDVRRALAAVALQFSGRDLPPVTVSIGVAEMPEHGGTLAEVLRAADRALYNAKNGGRNRVVVADCVVTVPGALQTA